MRNFFLFATMLLLAPQARAAEQTAKPAAAPSSAKTTAPAYEKKSTYFLLERADGGKTDLASFAGKPVLVVFLRAHCPYCRAAMPMLGKITSAYGSKGLTVIGITQTASAEDAGRIVEEYALPFPLLYNGKEVQARYHVPGAPSFFLLSRSHDIHKRWYGYDYSDDTEYNEITAAIETLLKSPAR